jgi:hypothetical protein
VFKNIVANDQVKGLGLKSISLQVTADRLVEVGVERERIGRDVESDQICALGNTLTTLGSTSTSSVEHSENCWAHGFIK